MSTTDDEGRQEDLSYVGRLEGRAGSNGGAAGQGTRGGSTAQSSSSSSTPKSKGKGKGKEKDTIESDVKMEGEEEKRELKGEGDVALKRTKEDLELLANLDPVIAERLVELDPTPISELLTTTKIMKAISTLTSATSIMQDMGSYGETPPGLPLATYADIVELLTSALSDVSQVHPDLRSPPAPLSLHHLEIARAKLSLPLQNAVPPPVPQSAGVEALLVISPHGRPTVLRPPPAPPSETSLLFAENARLALSALRPAALFPSPYISASPATPSFSARDTSPPTGPAPISKLPSELLLYIIQFARTAASEHVSNSSMSPNGRPAVVREVWNGRGGRSVRDEFGNPINALVGSNAAGQRFTLGLARVCKAWLEPARTVALRHLYIYQAPQIAQLLDILTTSPSLSGSISSIQAISAILHPQNSPEAASTAGPSVTLNRVIGRLAAPRHGRSATPSVSFGRPKDQDGGKGKVEEKSAAETWSQVVELCSNVKKLKLRILPSSNRWAGFSRNPSTTEFLDAAVLKTLSTTRTLTILNLAFSIDFDELEVIINGLPNLQHVAIRAIDCISGSPAVASTNPHPANKIRTFKLGDTNSSNPYNIQEYTAVSDVQLEWLLEPPIANGTLKELDIAIVVDPGVGGGWPGGIPGGPGGGFGANGNAPPFASSTFADLLIRCGANLEKLVLQDLSEGGGLNPNFVAPPHNSNFDHALSALTGLKEISLQFAYSGAGFLTSLSSLPVLRNLSLAGTPLHTSAEAFADKLEHGFGELENLAITGQFAGTRGGQGGWNGAGLRRVKQAAKERGLQGAFGG